jgi:hypothetical protein
MPWANSRPASSFCWANTARRAKISQFAEKSRRAVYSRKTESPSRPYFSQDADAAGPILSFAPRNGFARRSDSLRQNAKLFFARKILKIFRKKKRSIPFFSSAATYKVDEGQSRFAFETGSLVSASTEKNRFACSLDSAPRRRIVRDSQNNAQGKAA